MTTTTAPDGDGKITHVYLSDLIPNPKLQARHRLNDRTVEKYAKHLRNGGTFDTPILAALIRGKVYVVDGFHRREAYARTGEMAVPILLTEMTWDEALYRAGQANQKHGLPLSRRDADRARDMILRGYIGQKRHRRGREPKTIKDIRRELAAEGCAWSETGLRKALKRVNPRLYAKLWQQSKSGGLRALRDDDVSQLWDEATSDWANFLGKVKALPSSSRQRMAETIRKDLPDILEVPDADLNVLTF